MVITYFGGAYFKMTLGDLTIAVNPPSKASKTFSKPARFGADIALTSVNHPDWNGVETVALGNAQPFAVDGPGSYEVKNILFTGAKSSVVLEGKEYINTVYGFELDGIKIGIIGALSDETTLSSEAKELLSNADMLFVPIGGGELFDQALAYKVALSYEPNIILPYWYTDTTLARFLKEGGQEKVVVEEKLTIKRRDLDGKQGAIVVLSDQS